MSDLIVKRLRDAEKQLAPPANSPALFADAADEIKRQRALLVSARDGLREATELLSDYTDACGSEQTGSYLSYEGQVKVAAIKARLTKLEKELAP